MKAATSVLEVLAVWFAFATVGGIIVGRVLRGRR